MKLTNFWFIKYLLEKFKTQHAYICFTDCIAMSCLNVQMNMKELELIISIRCNQFTSNPFKNGLENVVTKMQ
ncbi:hypothetical protein BLOT_009366 [Blomia tropicalis]|nr:hypothetical protein BLOT_009366 [Blomia tropicalis]